MTMPNSGEIDPQVTPNKDEKNEGSGGAANGQGGGITEASKEDLLEEIKKLRAESAAKRVENRKAKTELQEFQEWKRSQMSEAEKLKADLEEAKQSAMAAYTDVFADKYNVPAERRKFIAGQTKEEIEEACKALGEQKSAEANASEGKKAESMPNLFPGTRGSAVGSKSNGTDFDTILREQLQRK